MGENHFHGVILPQAPCSTITGEIMPTPLAKIVYFKLTDYNRSERNFEKKLERC